MNTIETILAIVLLAGVLLLLDWMFFSGDV